MLVNLHVHLQRRVCWQREAPVLMSGTVLYMRVVAIHSPSERNAQHFLGADENRAGEAPASLCSYQPLTRMILKKAQQREEKSPFYAMLVMLGRRFVSDGKGARAQNNRAEASRPRSHIPVHMACSKRRRTGRFAIPFAMILSTTSCGIKRQ